MAPLSTNHELPDRPWIRVPCRIRQALLMLLLGFRPLAAAQESTDHIARGVPDTCLSPHHGLPVAGVRYIPHLVGEPYPHPQTQPWGYYTDSYSGMHQRDLPLIGNEGAAADTLLLRPWPAGEGSAGKRANFFTEMQFAGICRVIPTFQAAKHYADMLYHGFDRPKTDPSSPLAVDFSRFGATVKAEALSGISMAAWTVDLSLDLSSLLRYVGEDCESSRKVAQDKSFQMYMTMLSAIWSWVHPMPPSASAAPDLAAAPFLLPLDVSRASFLEPKFYDKLNTLLRCMSLDVNDGGWSRLFSSTVPAPTRWLLSFSHPLYQRETYDFKTQLRNITDALTSKRAVIMVGTQALRRGGENPINSVNLQEDVEFTGARYLHAVLDYFEVQEQTRAFDGFIYDEWTDDWDRGSRGPFFLAAESVEEMEEPCPDGGRFSHDVQRCSRVAGDNGHIFPEYFGLSSASSQILHHCARLRFRELFPRGGKFGHSRTIGALSAGRMHCAVMIPNKGCLMIALGLLVFVAVVQVSRLLARLACGRPNDDGERSGEGERVAATSSSAAHGDETRQRRVGYITVTPRERLFRGEHTLELRSTRLRTDQEVGWWLWSHASTQQAILDKQVQAELEAMKAIRARRRWQAQAPRPHTTDEYASEGVDDFPNPEEDLARAMQVIHRRVLEGFAAWCDYAAGTHGWSCCRRRLGREGFEAQELRTYTDVLRSGGSLRPASRLFAEALLLRTMESLGEHILQCPERLSYLLFKILCEAGGLEDIGPAAFSIDLDELQDGLAQMQLHSNPYVRAQMPNGQWELGLNFDDINECGLQRRPKVTKTFKEPPSVMVLIDFFLCYRVPIILKLYCFALSGYIYLGSHMGNDITTSNNGSFFKPQWLRINFIQYSALGDAAMWVLMEALLICYVGWQRWPSLCWSSPGIPGARWLLEHAFNLCVSAFGGLWVLSVANFARKPWACAQSSSGTCLDPRAHDTMGLLLNALVYWLVRIVTFVAMSRKRTPVLVYGTPGSKVREAQGRGCNQGWWLDVRVGVAWACMLAACIVIEVMLLFPTMQGLDVNVTCGVDMGSFSGLPRQQGVCTYSENFLAFDCIACVSSLSAGWLLVILGSVVDIYFVFYISAAVVGSFMGHRRGLNDLKNTSLPVDLRERSGKEALQFERVFGPGWQHVWQVMIRGLAEESLISPNQADALIQASGVSARGDMPLTQRDRRQKPIHLARFPQLASERLAFLFRSLQWIERDQPGRDAHFHSATDALTGPHFDPGSVPSLTQIIPAYNEVVIPAVEFLRTGADPEDAKNGSADDQLGLGDLTVPPQGDGVNTNLAFLISQFPDEWVFLAQRLNSEGLAESADSHELYRSFMKERQSVDAVIEIRIWAAMRMQSVAKTVLGALQYARALASIPKFREYYRQFPGKRICEDHAEVILAHQTYGHTEGSEKNDEAVRLLLERCADEPLYLVFDLKEGSSAALWNMVDQFLVSRGGCFAFEQASVKCRWDVTRRGLKVLEVLPRKFPLRLGQGDFKTQGKACNQLNGLRFASGHYVQALDCNMGTYIGEAFKVPYVLRTFMPLDKEDRTAPRCRYLGFREFIYTKREGTVGKCHAAAEWTFGTIYQRFLSGIGMRMHYGHPDFLDGFWARNRGGMSKSSPIVNLSEDIFAGFNVRMREEASPHIDALEFEKGREASFNAASNFFSKISGGSVAMLRSRDNHLLCERIGVLHSLSFYFASVAFYTSNLIVDLSIYLYVIVFILFSLTGLSLSQLAALGSTFGTEWIFSMGLLTLVPQICESVLEHGAVKGCKEVFSGAFAATCFYIFQNKNIASSMKEGTKTGVARYFFTGRPPANQHQTWKDVYVMYWKSHFRPAFTLMFGYTIYACLARQSGDDSRLSMLLVIVSALAWVLTPMLFSPLPRWPLIRQDLRDFSAFIVSGAGASESEVLEVSERGRRGTVRSLYECGLAEELRTWTEASVLPLVLCAALKAIVAVFVAAVLPAEVLDFMAVYLVALSLSWVAVLLYFVAGLNNSVLVLSFLVWPCTMPFAHHIIGDRFSNPSFSSRLPELLISFTVFFYCLGVAKEFVLILCRALHSARAVRHLSQCVRLCFVYFFVHQQQVMEASIVLVMNFAASTCLATMDKAFFNIHTWFLLSAELARTKRGERYMEKTSTFFEMDGLALEQDFWPEADDSASATASVHARRG